VRRAWQISAIVSLVLALLSAREASADTAVSPNYPDVPKSKLWRQHWPAFSPWEGAATIAAGIGTGALFMLQPPKDARWEGGNWFDDAVRDGMRLESADAREKVRAAGDMPYFAAPVIPLIIDPLVAAWIARGDAKSAINLELMGLEAFSYAGLLSFVSTRTSLRQRPDSSECWRERPDGKGCDVDTASFWSGHTSIAAASAGLVCANHGYMPLWGHVVADVDACVLATTGAVATGMSRPAADHHYATDVAAGFGVGFGVGYAVPTLIHYTRRKSSLSNVSVSVSPGSPCTGACLKVAGSF
jgi:membrane-associated phospholipid phosphatase